MEANTEIPNSNAGGQGNAIQTKYNNQISVYELFGAEYNNQ